MSDDQFWAEWERGRTEARAQAWGDVVPARFAGAAVDDFDGKVGQDLRGWGESENPSNLLIVGPVGPGKTRAAIAAARMRWDRGASVAFWPMGELLESLKPHRDGDLAPLVNVDVLVLDDFGTERITEWTIDRVYLVVNRRWMEERPIVATTNLSPRALEAVAGERTYSRLAHDAVAIQITGPDRRRPRKP